MKRKILACLLTLSLLLGLLPGAALAVDETAGGEPLVVCAELEGCIEDTHAEGCPLYVAPDEPANETDDVTDPVGPTAAEQLAAMIAALPAPEDIDPLDEEQVKAVNDQIAEIYAFAEENGLGNSEDGLNDGALDAVVNAVIAAAWPTAPMDAVSSITSNGGELVSGTYQLTENVTLSSANLTIPENAEVTIDLNGHTLTGNGNGSVITVKGTLIIQDSGTNGKITNGNSGETESLYGGGVRVDGGSLTLTGGAISGNTSKDGGGVYITNSGTFAMTGGEISGNTCVISNSTSTYPYGSGAGVFVNSGTFTMSGGAIKDNVFGSQGGGVFVSAGASFELKNGEISGNTASQGGGVLVNGTFTMNGGSISKNTVTIPESVKSVFAGTTLRGGGVLLNSANAVFNFNGGTISENNAVSASNKDNTSVAAFAGGVCASSGTNVYVSGAPIVSRNTVDNEQAENIWLATGNILTLSGDVASTANLPVTLEGVSGRVTDCGNYTMASGVVHCENSELTVQVRNGDTYFAKTVSVDDAVCSATIGGETIYYETLAAALADLPTDDNTITLLKNIDADTTATLPLGKAQLTTNLSEGVTITWKGGSGNCFVVPAQSELTVSGAVTIQADSSSETAPKSAFSVAGILNIGEIDASSEYPKVTGFNVKNNDGGAVNISAGGTLNLYSGCLTANEGSTGGAIYATGESAKVNLYGGTINGNKATNGGGVAVTTSAVLTISGAVISGNEASSNGGGIYLNNASATMTAGKVGGTSSTDGLNTAIKGGGVYIDNGNSVFNMTGGNIDYNTVANTTGGAQGGGVHINNGTFTLSGLGSISNNKIENGNAANGGGIYMNTGTLNVQGGTVASNSVKRTDGSEGGYGGGIYANKGTFNMTAGQVSENASYRGGGLYLADSGLTATISGGSISENNATNAINSRENWGGGVYVANATLNVTGGNIVKNNATHKGGGIFIATNGMLSLSDGTISENKALQGGGIYTYGTAKISGSPVVYKNTSDGSKENNIYLQAGKQIVLSSPLTAGAAIGVTTATKITSTSSPIQITTAESGTDYYSNAAQYFIPDAANVIAEASDEASKYVKLSYTTDTYYKVTLDLSNITTADGLIQNIKSGNQYSTTIIADTGYTLPTEKPDGVNVYNVSGTSASVKINTVSEAKTITIAGVANTYTVKFDGNDATSGSMSDKAMTYDTAENLTENAYKKTGYNFAGWSTTKNGDSVYPDGVSVKNLTAENGATVTLYAVWTAKEVIPAFDSGDKAIQSYKYDGTAKEYALSSEVENFTIKYKETGSEAEATETKPTTVGTYDVVISRTEDATYAAFEQTISGGLVITAADYPVSITANGETSLSMTGSGTVKLAPSSSAKGITVTGVTCSDATISVTANGDGTYSATLPNTTKTYTFTAQVSGDLSNYGDGPATCTVSVTRSGGGSSGGSSFSSYTVSVDSTKNGTVSVSPRNASKGTTVTITVKPDSGYELDELTVTDKNGDELRLTRKSDTQYTFTMPSGKVKVEASFAEIEDASDESLSFVDVPSNAYYADAVAWAVENGITAGTSATTFSPDASCTRAQMVTFLWRAAGSPKATGSNPFSDVVSGSYYYDAVLWAVENGITSGTSATTFAPDAIVTRGQTVTFLHRAAGSPATSGSSFADVSADAYYADAVAWAVSESITVGTSNNTFSPDANCTRGQIVTFMFRNAQ